jgi:hypothetical protein
MTYCVIQEAVIEYGYNTLFIQFVQTSHSRLSDVRSKVYSLTSEIRFVAHVR